MTIRSLHLAKGLDLPLDVVTQKLAWLGVTGSGKTYGASKLFELLFHAGAQVVALDPVGVWYGLRLDKGGKKPSDITVPIFGGLHGDVPLEPTGGALLANLIVDKALSAIVDVSQFESDAAKARFAADFADRLFQRRKAAPSAMHLFLEECQEFVPQNPQRGDERMLHVFTRMQKLGRNYGIGSSYLSQRPQEVNKKALNMAQTLFVFRTTGVHERKAIESWVHDKALDQDIAGDLPKIATGHCHVWSPEFLEISHQVAILPKDTFNASATPEVGAAAVTRELAPIDLAKIAKDMAATIEKAKADDPRELRKQIAELKKERDKAVENSRSAENLPKALKNPHESQKPVLTDADRALIEKLLGTLSRNREIFDGRLTEMQADLDRRLKAAAESFSAGASRSLQASLIADINALDAKGFQKILGKLATVPAPTPHTPPTAQTAPRSPLARRVDPAPSTSRPARQVSVDGELDLGRDNANARMLAVIKQYPGADARRVGALAGVSPRLSTFRVAIGKLRGAGLIDGGRDSYRLTEAGERAAADIPLPPTGEEAILHWRRELGDGAARQIFDALVTAAEHGRSAGELQNDTGVDPSVSTFRVAIGKLRNLELIAGDRGRFYANQELFS